jgi:hypothetical protein
MTSSCESQDVESVKLKWRASAAVVLEYIKGWATGFVERYKFAIYARLVRKLRERLCQNWKSSCEIILVPRHQPHAASALDSVAIELDFVFPIRTLRQLRNRKALHRFDESSRLFWTPL